MRKKAKILIIEDAEIIQQGLAYILTKKNKMNLSLIQCSVADDLHAILSKTEPDILIAALVVFENNNKLIKVQKEMNGLKTVALIYTYHRPNVLTNFHGYIYLEDKNEVITATVNNLLQPSLTDSLSVRTTSNDVLSEREKEVLKLLAEGSSTKKIAEMLFISPHTVNAHRKNIMRKLDIKTISGLTIYAVLNNIISLEEG